MTTKSEILSALERSRGEFVSGVELAQMLHISRTAVWKAIKQLEQEGHGIETLVSKATCSQARVFQPSCRRSLKIRRYMY